VRDDPSAAFKALSNGSTFKVIRPQVGQQIAIQLLQPPCSSPCTWMSDERWADPRSAFRALSNGSTFERIAALVPELFPIQLVSATV
jgi:hypothetical protein